MLWGAREAGRESIVLGHHKGRVLYLLALARFLADSGAQIWQRARRPVPGFPSCPRAHASVDTPFSPRRTALKDSAHRLLASENLRVEGS